jgi:hypothetical protein
MHTLHIKVAHAAGMHDNRLVAAKAGDDRKIKLTLRGTRNCRIDQYIYHYK